MRPPASTAKLQPSNTSSSWPPTRFRYANGTPFSRARAARFASRSACLPFWKGEALMDEHEVRTGRAAPGNDVGMPDVLADDRRDPHAAEFDRDEGIARREVALLVEDLVVRQPLLAVVRDAPPVAEPGRGSCRSRRPRTPDSRSAGRCRARRPRAARSTRRCGAGIRGERAGPRAGSRRARARESP